MFYSQFILAKKGPLGTIWIAAHLERKLRKNQVADTDIGVSVDSILFPDVPIALRLSSHLLLGVVRIYSRKVNYLFHDCSEALLKVKQAFRSTAVDLPPEESTAPYHSITLPETFHLDDFELPDTAFQGDDDRHISAKEQITLQDNLERMGFSTSKFGLDERFGDGSTSHIGLDLDEVTAEDLFLTKKDKPADHASTEPASDDAALQQGESSAPPPTEMEIDYNQNQTKPNPELPNWIGSYNIQTPGYNVQTPGYNIQTPDLNEMFFPHNSHVEGPPSMAATPFAGDAPSPELTECAPPSTPGLMEETVLPRVRVHDVASPSINNDDISKAEGPVLHPCAGGTNDGITPNASDKSGNNVSDKSVVNLEGQKEDLCIDQFADKSLPVEEGVSEANIQLSEPSAIVVNPVETTVESTLEVPGEGPAAADNPITENIITEPEPISEQMLSKDLPASDKPDGPSNSKLFPETEKMLQATTEMDGNQANNLLGQVTTEKVVLESDGSVDRISSLAGKKRRLEDSSLDLENGNSDKMSSRPRANKRNNSFVPDDDDLLASILVGKRTPGLRLGPTPQTNNKSVSLKRQRLTPKTGVHKRKVLLDDAMVLHADVIRQQLINTEDIRRVRKKAPCTRSEIWIIEKGPLEDEIFNESIFTGMPEELESLQHRAYEIDTTLPSNEPDITNNQDLLKESEEIEKEKEKETTTEDCMEPVPDMEMPVQQQDPSIDVGIELERQLANNEEPVQPSDEIQENREQPVVMADLGDSYEAPVFASDANLPEGGAGLVTDDMKDEMDDSKINVDDMFETKENPDPGFIDEVSVLLPQEENATSAFGENSVLQENNNIDNNNPEGYVDMDMENDLVLKEVSDFGSAIEGVDTDFLNADDEADDYYEEANDNDVPNPEGFNSLENSGWSSRTRGVARYLKVLFDEETGRGRKSVAVDLLLTGKTRKEASRMFFETLVLKTRDYINVEQEKPFGFINIKPGIKLMKSEF